MAAARRGTSAASRSHPRPQPLVAAPEELLRKAMMARSPAARARWARQGLATRVALHKTTETMLLRQLYLAHYELRRFERAEQVAMKALDVGVLVDVLHQDVARASLARGHVDEAVAHLRLASRKGPASRRPFHLWTLGSVLFFAHRYSDAIAALGRAVRWGTRDKPLYRAQLALVRVSAGEHVEGLQEIIDDLASVPCGQGYGRFVLGHLAYAAGAWEAARRYLGAFVRRTEEARPVLAIALDSELRMARATLAKMAAN